MRRKQVEPSQDERKQTRKGLIKAAKEWDQFKPASEVLIPIRAVRTRFIQFDHATKCGGMPLGRIYTIHGESAGGKTQFGMGLLASAIEAGGWADHYDAERTTDPTFPAKYMGEQTFLNERNLAYYPPNYEEAVNRVRSFTKMCRAKQTFGLTLVDSLRKLTPKGIVDRLAKEAGDKSDKDVAKGVDGFGGRAAQVKAALNASWLDELVPMMSDAQCIIAFIARESEKADAQEWERKANQAYKVGGGKALIFDSSLVVRVERVGWVMAPGSEDTGEVWGTKHRVLIRKTKMSALDGKVTECFFYTSNGTGNTPEGFDPAMDAIDLAVQFKIVTVSGGWLEFGSHKWQGKHQACKALYADPIVFRQLDQAVRAAFSTAPTRDIEDKEEEWNGYDD